MLVNSLPTTSWESLFEYVNVKLIRQFAWFEPYCVRRISIRISLRFCTYLIDVYFFVLIKQSVCTCAWINDAKKINNRLMKNHLHRLSKLVWSTRKTIPETDTTGDMLSSLYIYKYYRQRKEDVELSASGLGK